MNQVSGLGQHALSLCLLPRSRSCSLSRSHLLEVLLQLLEGRLLDAQGVGLCAVGHLELTGEDDLCLVAAPAGCRAVCLGSRTRLTCTCDNESEQAGPVAKSVRQGSCPRPTSSQRPIKAVARKNCSSIRCSTDRSVSAGHLMHDCLMAYCGRGAKLLLVSAAHGGSSTRLSAGWTGKPAGRVADRLPGQRAHAASTSTSTTYINDTLKKK